MTAVQVGFDVLDIKEGDRVIVQAHDHDMGEYAIPRKGGKYQVVHIFQNGNLWAEPINHVGQAVVIQPCFVIGRQE